MPESLLEGESQTTSVKYGGTHPVNISWTKDGVPIDVTSGSLDLNNITSADAGVYAITISNAYGTTTKGSFVPNGVIAYSHRISDAKFNPYGDKPLISVLLTPALSLLK